MSTTTATPQSRTATREQRVREARQLQRDGLDHREIAAEMEVHTSTVYGWLKQKDGKPKPNSLNREAWCAFVEEFTRVDDQDAVRINDRTLSDAHTRSLFRWTREGCNPGFFSTDEFCVAVGLHIELFLAWCEQHTPDGAGFRSLGDDDQPVSPWALGEAPGWWAEEVPAELPEARWEALAA